MIGVLMQLEEPKPKYRQVADLLRDAINRGEYAPGAMLPSQPRLAEQFGISQTLVSKAIGVLAQEGLVRTTSAGTTIRPLPMMPRYAVTRSSTASRESGGARGAFDAEVRRLGFTPSVVLVQVGQVAAPADAVEYLGIDEGEPVAIRQRRMFADSHPVMVSTSYIPWSFAEGTAILEEDTGPGGTYSRLAESGHAPAMFTESVRLRTPTPAEAHALDLSEGQQVFVCPRVARDSDGVAVEVNFQILPPHQWELHYEWPAEPPS